MAQLANTVYMKEDDVFPSVAAWEERVMAIVKQGGLYGISETRLMEDYHLVLCANWDNDDIECEAGSSAIWENGNLVVAGFTMPHNDRCIAHQRAALRNQDLQFDNQVQVQQSPSPPYQAYPSQSTTIQPTAPTQSPRSVDPPAEIHQDSQAHHQKEESASSPPDPPIAPQAPAVEPIPAQDAIANSDMEMSVDEVIREPSITQQEAQQPIDFRETSTQGPDNPHRLLLQYAARSSPSKLRRLSKTSSTEGVLSWLQQQSVIERENAHANQGSHDRLPTVAASHKQSTIGETSTSGRQELSNAQNDIQPSPGVIKPETSRGQFVTHAQRKSSPPISNSTSNINSTTLPSVKGKGYDYAKPLTEKDKHDPDYFRIGRQFESYESFDKCLAAWHEKAFPDDFKERYIARRENRNGKPRVICSLREKVMTFRCPFLIKLHPLPGDKGYEVFQSDTRHSDECNKRLERDHQELLKKQASSYEESSDEESGKYSQAGTTSSKRNARRSVSASSRTAKRKPKHGLKRKRGRVKSDRFASSSSDSDESSANESESDIGSDSDSERNATDLAEYSGTRSWRKANKSENIQNMKNNNKKKTKATKGHESMTSSKDSTSSAAESTSGAGSDPEKESPASDIEMADSKIEHSLIAIQAESSSSSESDSDSSGDETSSMSGASGDLPEKTTRTAEKHVEAGATLEDVKVPKRNSDTAAVAVTSAASMQVDAVDGIKDEQLPVKALPREELAATTTTQEHEAAAEDDNFESIDDEAARLKAARQVTFREQGFEDLLCDRLELHHIRNFQDMIDAGLREMDFEELIIFVFQEEPFAKDNKRFITKVELHFAKKHLQCMMAVEADLLSGEEQKA